MWYFTELVKGSKCYQSLALVAGKNNEALNYSEMFHCIIGALKWDQLEKFPNNNLESSKTGLQDNLESFQMAWKVSRWTGMFTDGLECFQMAWNGLDGLESFQMAWKVSR